METMSNFTDDLRAMQFIAGALPDDDPDKIELLNNEANYSERMDIAIFVLKETQAFADGVKGIIESYQIRQKSLKNKAENIKKYMALVMDNANERSYKSAAGTISYRATTPSVVIVDEDKIPDKYKKTTITVDKQALKKALQDGDVLGAQLSNGGESLQVRIK